MRCGALQVCLSAPVAFTVQTRRTIAPAFALQQTAARGLEGSPRPHWLRDWLMPRQHPILSALIFISPPRKHGWTSTVVT
jgi:hypothetical protein